MNIITTAGFNKEYPCYSVLRKSAIDILEGKIYNDNLFACIFTLDDEDDWNDESVWFKSNPNLNASVEFDTLKKLYIKASQQGGSTEVKFKTKNLNIWTDASEVWIKDEDWQKCSFGINKELLKGRKCFGGLDLASGIDLNAFVLFFPDIDGKHCILPFFFMPEKKFKESTEFDYLTARNEGYLFITPGASTDVEFMTQKIIQIVSQYDFQSGSYDRWKALNGTIQALQKEDMKLNQLGQGYQSQSVPCQELEKLVNELKIEHFNNKMLRWMVGNVELTKDAAGNIKLDKGKSSNKIDGIAALVDAIAEWLLNYNSGSSFMDNPDNDLWL